ncbi:hypothetical protein ACLB2K_074415 [Fragaria x ananassa]
MLLCEEESRRACAMGLGCKQPADMQICQQSKRKEARKKKKTGFGCWCDKEGSLLHYISDVGYCTYLYSHGVFLWNLEKHLPDVALMIFHHGEVAWTSVYKFHDWSMGSGACSSAALWVLTVCTSSYLDRDRSLLLSLLLSGVISLDLAKCILKNTSDSYAVVVSTEIITANWYFGTCRFHNKDVNVVGLTLVFSNSESSEPNMADAASNRESSMVRRGGLMKNPRGMYVSLLRPDRDIIFLWNSKGEIHQVNPSGPLGPEKGYEEENDTRNGKFSGGVDALELSCMVGPDLRI